MGQGSPGRHRRGGAVAADAATAAGLADSAHAAAGLAEAAATAGLPAGLADTAMSGTRATGPAWREPCDEPSPSGAEGLIGELYRAHGLALVRVALMLVGDRATAEDVVQDAFIGLFRGLHRLQSPDKALAYLRASVVNGCRSVHRSRRAAILRAARPDPPVWSAEAAVMAREDSRLALEAVSRLPRRAREVLALRYYLDMPDLEIAAALGISRGTVSSTASRALTALARALREEL